MPRRLLLAAELVKDVAEAVPDADRAALLTVMMDLQRRAEAMAEAQAVALDERSQVALLRPSICRLAAALAPQDGHGADRSMH